MGGPLTIHAGEAEAQKHKAENYFSNFTRFKHAHMIFRPCKEDFLTCIAQRSTRVSWTLKSNLGRDVCLSPGEMATLFAIWSYFHI
jgi:hypothetical protein